MAATVEVSDGYIGLYSHDPRFFPAPNVDAGYIQVLCDARGIRG